jgi:hypothetical protein
MKGDVIMSQKTFLKILVVGAIAAAGVLWAYNRFPQVRKTLGGTTPPVANK